jgi:glycosyltransferase involved in cell wall biosynthesis
MRFLVLNWQDITNPQAGGAEVHLHEVFERIAQRGHEVTLYCSHVPGAPPEETIRGIHIIREGGRHLFNFRVIRAYFSKLRHGKFDIIIDDMNKIPFFTPLFVKEPIHGITHHLFGRSIFREVNAILALYVYVMERAAVWLYRRKRIPFIVGSPSTHRELIERGFQADDVALVHYGVDHARHKRTGIPRSPTPLVAYFGRLKKYKSVDHLLRALPAVLKQVPELKLMVVGEGDDRPRLESLTKELGLERVVEFTGFVSEERKIELLQQIWFKVTTSSKEGWGLTVIEANACGTPVLASDVPGLRDAVRHGETGLLYRYGDVGDLADKMILLLQDMQLRERLTTGAIEWAKSFDWDAAAAKTLELLKERLKQ